MSEILPYIRDALSVARYLTQINIAHKFTPQTLYYGKLSEKELFFQKLNLSYLEVP